jgi:hypothetical protein
LGKPSEEQLQKFSPCPTGTLTSYVNYAAKQRKKNQTKYGAGSTRSKGKILEKTPRTNREMIP